MEYSVLSSLKRKEIDFLEKFVEESNAIENIIYDPGEIREKLISGELEGHTGALLLLSKLGAKFDSPFLTKRLVCEVQRLIIEEHIERFGGLEVVKAYLGRYRGVRVCVGLRECIHPELVPLRMKFLLEDMNQWFDIRNNFTREEHIKKVADFHYNFEMIHPFVDGNGRTGRALVYYVFLRLGIKPFIFTSRDKAETYYPCFDKNDSYLMQNYFLRKTGLIR